MDRGPVHAALLRALAALIVAVIPVTAASATLSGTVTCGDCVGGIGVLAEVEGGGFEVGDSRWLASAGPFELTVLDDAGDVSVFAFRDVDANGIPDGGSGVVAYAENPIAVFTDDVSGIDITLPAATIESVGISGTVTCADCGGGVALVVEGGVETLAAIRLAEPGDFELAVPADVGEIELYAYRDADGDGLADSGSGLVAYADNPIAVAAGDIDGVTIDLGRATADAVALRGTVVCADCAGSVGVFAVAESGEDTWVASAALAMSGPYELLLPVETGDVALFAFRDADRDGVADAGSSPIEYPGNPVTVASDDIAGLDIDLGRATADRVGLSGELLCDDCAGNVAVLAISESSGAGPDVQAAFAAPGSYAIAMLPDIGEVSLFAFRDADGNGVPDPGTGPVAYDGNPVDVGDADISGLDIDLGTATAATVSLGGSVTCSDCAGAIGVTVESEEGFGTLAHIGLASPGGYRIELLAESGEVSVWAHRDADRDGTPDAGTDPVPYARNPVPIAGLDVDNIDIDLGTATRSFIGLSGRVICADCTGGVGVEAEIESDFAGGSQARYLAEAGAYRLDVSPGTGEVWLYAFRDHDGNGRPDSGTDRVGYAGNPVVVEEADLDGLDIDLGIATLTLVRVAGTVLAEGHTGPVAVGLSALDGAGFGLADQLVQVAEPGPFALDVPANTGEAELYGFRDADGDGRPDGGCDEIPYADNPLVIGDDDIEGLVLDVSACRAPLPPIPTSAVLAGAGEIGVSLPEQPPDDETPGGDDGCGCAARGRGDASRGVWPTLALLLWLFSTTRPVNPNRRHAAAGPATDRGALP